MQAGRYCVFLPLLKGNQNAEGAGGLGIIRGNKVGESE